MEAKKEKKYKNKAWLEEEYLKKERLPEEIGRECGVDRTTISRWLDRFKIPKRWVGEEVRIAWDRSGWVRRKK